MRFKITVSTDKTISESILFSFKEAVSWTPDILGIRISVKITSGLIRIICSSATQDR